ncbi:MAG: cyclic nucleotide-binding domain-containing protein [Pseudomonadota bacterium]
MIESNYLQDKAIIDKLKQINIFKPFNDSDLEGMLKLSKIRQYKPGEMILREGNYDCWIYFLISGAVRIVKTEKEIGTLQRRGDVFGEMSVIDGSVRSASIYAVNDVVCLATDGSYIERLSGNDKVLFCYILFRIFSELLSERLRETSQDLVEARGEISELKKKLYR